MSNNYQWVVKPEEYHGYPNAYLVDGVCPYTKKTAEQWAAEGYTVMDTEEYDALNAEYERRLAGDWTEISEEDYAYSAEVLPPLKWYNGGFFVSEGYSGTLHGFYQELNGRYYTSLQSIFTNREEILDSLRQYLAA